MKKCRKCGIEKMLSEFPKHKSLKDGHRAQCIACYRVKRDAWEKDNHEKKLQLRTEYRERNREKIRLSDQTMYASNPEKHRQRMRKSVDKYLGSKGKETRKKHREENPELYEAWKQYQSAIKKGILIRPESCQICGKNCSRIEGHHSDYSKPLDVIWVCKTCHRHIHRKIDHAERLNEKTSKEDAIVCTHDESVRGISEEGTPLE